jgi:polar amino acid transport system substrate-binding protein
MGSDENMSEKVDRRSAIKTTGAAVAGIVIGAAAGWALKPVPPSPPKAKFAEAPPEGTEVTIVHGFDAAYPPFTEIDPTGKAVGFDVEVVNWIAEKYGWKVVPKPWDWAAIVTALVEGDLDIVMSGMSHTAERAEKVWFTIPYYPYYHQLMALATETRTMNELLNSGEYISCQLGATGDKWAEKLLAAGNNFKKLALDSYALAFEAVKDGRAVAAISDSAFTGSYLEENPGIFKEVGKIGGIETYAAATRPGDYWLRNQVNYALEEIMASPLWDELKEKWKVL